MTFSNQTNRISAVGSGAIGQEVPFSFPYAATSDLKVYSRVTATGVETLLAETTNYTLTVASDTGGTLTTVTAIETTETIHIIRDTPMTQLLDLEQGGSFNAEDIEDALDKNTKLPIENSDALERTLVFPATDPVSSFADMPNSVDRANKNLTFDSDGKPIASVVVEEGDVAFTDFGTSIAEAVDADTARGLLELDTDDDVEFAEGTFSDLITKGPRADVRAFGAVGDGVADDTAAIQSAIDSLTDGGVLYFPKGDYYVSDTFTITKRINIIGDGYTTQIFQSADKSLFVLDIEGATGFGRNIVMRNLFLGSAATSSDTALIKLVDCHRSSFENITLRGGNKGIWLYGSLLNTFTNIFSGNIRGFFETCSNNQYFVYAERVGTTSSNANTFIAPYLEGGVYGFYLSDTAGQGGITIIGGVCEGLTEYGLYGTEFYGITIIGTHFEASKGIYISGGWNHKISPCICSSIQLDSCTASVVEGVYGTTLINIDPDCIACEVRHCYAANVYNFSKSSKVFDLSRPGGIPEAYCRGLRFPNVRLITTGNMESWTDGLPDGFGKHAGCTVTKETTIVRSGGSSAKIAKATIYYEGIKVSIPADYAGQFISVEAWVYVGDSGGANINYIEDTVSYTIESKASVTETWEKLTATFYYDPSHSNVKIVFGGAYGSQNTTYYDDINVWAESGIPRFFKVEDLRFENTNILSYENETLFYENDVLTY